ncbi:MAG: hypothetical protein JSU64_07895 [candidate division WOR-3 bacterium]|nr:MAG: hypothetical protein JSU64_07895 [candidate division WOR-3 bacterium]
MKKNVFDGLAPVCRRHSLCLYERDLRARIRIVEPKLGVRTVVYDRPVDSEMVLASGVCGWFAAGDRMFVAYHGDAAVGHLLAATGECPVGEIDDRLLVEENEVYFYAAHTEPRFRGNLIYPYLITTASEHFRRRSYWYAMIFSTRDNMRSRKGIERSAFNLYGKVDYWNLLGLKSWRFTVGDRHVRSRLRAEC